MLKGFNKIVPIVDGEDSMDCISFDISIELIMSLGDGNMDGILKIHQKWQYLMLQWGT